MKTASSLLVVSCCALAVVALSPTSSAAQVSPPAASISVSPPITTQASATVYDATGARLGVLSFSDSPAGLLVSGVLTALPVGTHGIHLHAVGQCEPPFTTAGGHLNPAGAKHGFRNPMGHHAGDMTNVTAQPGGAANVDLIVYGVTLTGAGGLLDADGASVVVHAGADDYMTDPAGASGARIACGVIVAK